MAESGRTPTARAWYNLGRPYHNARHGQSCDYYKTNYCYEKALEGVLQEVTYSDMMRYYANRVAVKASFGRKAWSLLVVGLKKHRVSLSQGLGPL